MMTQILIEPRVRSWTMGFLKPPNSGKTHLGQGIGGQEQCTEAMLHLHLQSMSQLGNLRETRAPSSEYQDMIQLYRKIVVEVASNIFSCSINRKIVNLALKDPDFYSKK